MTTIPPPPKPDDLRIEQAIRQRVGIGTLADLFSVLRMDKQNQLVRRMVKKQQDGTLGADTGDDAEEESEQVHVGDQYIVQPPVQPAAQPAVTAKPWTIAQLATAAAGLGGGVGLPVAAAIVAASMMAPGATPEPARPVETPATVVAPAGHEGRIGLLPPDEVIPPPVAGTPPATAFDVPPVGEPLFLPPGTE